jgi:hypothetical protein
MEHEISLPLSQKSNTGPYSEPDESTLQTLIVFFLRRSDNFSDHFIYELSTCYNSSAERAS